MSGRRPWPLGLCYLMTWGHFCVPAAHLCQKRTDTKSQFHLQRCMLEICFPAVPQSDEGSNWSSAPWYKRDSHSHSDRCIDLLSHLTCSVPCVVYCFGLVLTPGSITLLLSFYLFGNPNDTIMVTKSRDCWAFTVCVRPVLGALYLNPLYLYNNLGAGVTLSPLKEIRTKAKLLSKVYKL